MTSDIDKESKPSLGLYLKEKKTIPVMSHSKVGRATGVAAIASLSMLKQFWNHSGFAQQIKYSKNITIFRHFHIASSFFKFWGLLQILNMQNSPSAYVADDPIIYYTAIVVVYTLSVIGLFVMYGRLH